MNKLVPLFCVLLFSPLLSATDSCNGVSVDKYWVTTTTPAHKVCIVGTDVWVQYDSTDVFRLMLDGDLDVTYTGSSGGSGSGTSVWSVNGTSAYYNDGYVGIGLATPTSTLTVNGGIDVLDNYELNLGSNQGGGATLKYNGNGNLDITPRSGYSTVFTAGNVGIGTASPNSPLDVNRTFSSAYGIANLYNGSSSGNGLHIQTLSTSASQYSLAVANGSGYSMYVRADGKVGIGTTSPVYNTEVKSSDASRTALGLANTSTGYTALWFDAANGDFSGGDYAWIVQRNDLNLEIGVGNGASTGDIILNPKGSFGDAGYSYGGVSIGAESPGTFTLYVNGVTYSTAYASSSDSRLKNNIETIPSALTKVTGLRGVTFDWIGNDASSEASKWTSDPNLIQKISSKNLILGEHNKKFPKGRHAGLIAQELMTVLPAAVIKEEDGFLAINYDEVTALNLQAIKELKAEKDALAAEVADLKAKLETLLKK